MTSPLPPVSPPAPPAPPVHLATAALEPVEVAELPGPGPGGGAPGGPGLSVVVPTYNHRPLVLGLLEALSRQVGAGVEVVVVDDGSGDGTFAAAVGRATDLGLAGRIVRLPRNRGRSTARNLGILHARGEVIAFTDSDSLPAPGWLEAGLAPLADPAVGVVQGRTGPPPGEPQPFFNHFIEIDHFDGTFSTCNVFYRRRALLDAGGFDPGVDYWEDVDLGWRVRRLGWEAAFAPTAQVYHQVLPLTPWRWLGWPWHFRYMPAKVARYPEYRRFLFLGVWVHWLHALFDLALLALALGAARHRAFVLLALPYLLAFPIRHGLRGRWPPAKALLHLWWDGAACAVLLVSSARHRALVL